MVMVIWLAQPPAGGMGLEEFHGDRGKWVGYERTCVIIPTLMICQRRRDPGGGDEVPEMRRSLGGGVVDPLVS